MTRSARLRFLILALAVSVQSVQAQPPGPAPDAQGPFYPLQLRNMTAGMTAQLELPASDAVPGTIHGLVQLDRDLVAQARNSTDLQQALQRLLDETANSPIFLQRLVQDTTYEAVIDAQLAQALIDEPNGSLAPIGDALDDTIEELIVWVGSLPAAVKQDQGLINGRYEPWGLGPGSTFRLLVTLYPDVTDATAETIFDQLGVGPDQRAKYTDEIWRILLDRARLSDLVAEDSVRSVAQGPRPFTPLNDTARSAAGIENLQDIDISVDPPGYGGFSGSGIVVAVMEAQGIDVGHDDFWEHDVFGHKTQSRFTHLAETDLLGMHGTHVAGIVGGSGYQSTRLDSEGNPNGSASTMVYEWRGMAPEATIAWFDNIDSGGNVETQYDATVITGAAISNDSHEQEKCHRYDTIAETIDKLVNGSATWNSMAIPARAAVWSAGNNGHLFRACKIAGYFSLTTASKNPIVVGAINSDDNSIWEHSSLGPTIDGRLKPDVVAPGCNKVTGGIRSAATLDSGFPAARPDGYEEDCGTSMAAPVVTGAAALLLEQWRQVFGASQPCTAASGGGCFPYPSTLKALLIHGATDLVDVVNLPGELKNPDTMQPLQYQAGPDWATGYGLINASKSSGYIDFGPGLDRHIIESEISWSADPDEFVIDVDQGTASLKVTLAWDDPPGDALGSDSSKKLVHDLDLTLVRKDDDGAVIEEVLPWVLPPLTPKLDVAGDYLDYYDDPVQAADIQPPLKDVDDVNNVEQVEVATPAPTEDTTWTIRVSGDKLPLFALQRYSLVADFGIGLTTLNRIVGPDLRVCLELEWLGIANGFVQFEFPRGQDCGAVPFEAVCLYVFDCASRCDRFGCAPTDIRLAQVPEFFTVEVRNRAGQIVASDQSSERNRTLSWEPTPGEKYALMFVPVVDLESDGVFNIGFASASEDPGSR